MNFYNPFSLSLFSREILMTGSPNIKTPAMDVPLLPLPDAKEQGENIKKYFSRVLLKDVRERRD